MRIPKTRKLTGAARLVDRVRRRRPDVYRRFIGGELSAYAASVEAGVLRPQLTIPLRPLERTAEAIRRHMAAADIDRLIELLSEGGRLCHR